jgi:hypothetical protein
MVGSTDEPALGHEVAMRARERVTSVHDQLAVVQQVIEADRRRARSIGACESSDHADSDDHGDPEARGANSEPHQYTPSMITLRLL